MAVTFNASPEAESSLVTPSLQLHNSISPPKHIHLICASQAGSRVTKEPNQQQFPRLSADDQPPALTTTLPMRWLHVPRKPPSSRVVARIRFCPHHSYSSKRLLFSCSMSTASSSAMQEPSLCEEQSRIMLGPGHPYCSTEPARREGTTPVPAATC